MAAPKQPVANVRYPPGPYSVCFEGIDGCGKTTQSKMLTERLLEAETSAMWTYQPGDSKNLDLRNIILKSDICSKARHLLFAADNAQHVEDTVIPALNRGQVVVMDRGIGSAYAYQGYGEGYGFERVSLTYDWATNNFKPDLTILLDMSPQEASQRKTVNGNRSEDQIEAKGIQYQTIVRKGYLELAAQHEWRKIDVSRNLRKSEIADQVDEIIIEHFEAKL